MIAKQPKTRNRAKLPTWSFSGLDAATWRSRVESIQWAQNAPEFRDILTVLTNERRLAFSVEAGVTENRALGRLEGFEFALGVIRSLAEGTTPPPKEELEPTYPAETQPDYRD